MLTSFLFTRVCALAYANCTSANFMGFTSLLGGDYSHHFHVSGDKFRYLGLFDGISGLHASTVRAAGSCC
jgi:hypothetical protein